MFHSRLWSISQGRMLGRFVLAALLVTVFLVGSVGPAARAAEAVVATIPVGSSTVSVGVNATTNRIYVANDDDNTVSVIDGLTNTVIETIGVGSHPLRVGVNSVTNRIYVTNGDDSTVSVID